MIPIQPSHIKAKWIIPHIHHHHRETFRLESNNANTSQKAAVFFLTLVISELCMLGEQSTVTVPCHTGKTGSCSGLRKVKSTRLRFASACAPGSWEFVEDGSAHGHLCKLPGKRVQHLQQSESEPRGTRPLSSWWMQLSIDSSERMLLSWSGPSVGEKHLCCFEKATPGACGWSCCMSRTIQENSSGAAACLVGAPGELEAMD
nr:uncharacterized protein LOC125185071 [Anser cygnoides]